MERSLRFSAEELEALLAPLALPDGRARALGAMLAREAPAVRAARQPGGAGPPELLSAAALEVPALRMRALKLTYFAFEDAEGEARAPPVGLLPDLRLDLDSSPP